MVLEEAEAREPTATGRSLTVDQLLDLYLDGIDADGRLAAKTGYDYRLNADAYVRPGIGRLKFRDLSPEVILAWQRDLLAGVDTKRGKPWASPSRPTAFDSSRPRRSEADLRNASVAREPPSQDEPRPAPSSPRCRRRALAALGARVERRLITAIDVIDTTVSALSDCSFDQRLQELEHPQVLRRLDAANREILTLEHEAGLVPTAPRRPAPAVPGLGR